MSLPARIDPDFFEIAFAHSRHNLNNRAQTIVDLNGGNRVKNLDMQGMGSNAVKDLGLMTVVASADCFFVEGSRYSLRGMRDVDAKMNAEQAFTMPSDAEMQADLATGTRLDLDLLRALCSDIINAPALVLQVNLIMQNIESLPQTSIEALQNFFENYGVLNNFSKLDIMPEGMENIKTQIENLLEEIAPEIQNLFDAGLIPQTVLGEILEKFETITQKFSLTLSPEILIPLQGRMNDENYLTQSIEELKNKLNEVLQNPDLTIEQRKEIETLLEAIQNNAENIQKNPLILTEILVKLSPEFIETLPEAFKISLTQNVINLNDAIDVRTASILGISIESAKEIANIVRNIALLNTEAQIKFDTLSPTEKLIQVKMEEFLNNLKASPLSVVSLAQFSNLSALSEPLPQNFKESTQNNIIQSLNKISEIIIERPSPFSVVLRETIGFLNQESMKNNNYSNAQIQTITAFLAEVKIIQNSALSQNSLPQQMQTLLTKYETKFPEVLKPSVQSLKDSIILVQSQSPNSIKNDAKIAKNIITFPQRVNSQTFSSIPQTISQQNNNTNSILSSNPYTVIQAAAITALSAATAPTKAVERTPTASTLITTPAKGNLENISSQLNAVQQTSVQVTRNLLQNVAIVSSQIVTLANNQVQSLKTLSQTISENLHKESGKIFESFNGLKNSVVSFVKPETQEPKPLREKFKEACDGNCGDPNCSKKFNVKSLIGNILTPSPEKDSQNLLGKDVYKEIIEDVFKGNQKEMKDLFSIFDIGKEGKRNWENELVKAGGDVKQAIENMKNALETQKMATKESYEKENITGDLTRNSMNTVLSRLREYPIAPKTIAGNATQLFDIAKRNLKDIFSSLAGRASNKNNLAPPALKPVDENISPRKRTFQPTV